MRSFLQLLTSSSLCIAVAVGCQKLPPGVLAGSQPGSPPSAPEVPDSGSLAASKPSAVGGESASIAELRLELDLVRRERDRLREEVVRSQEAALAAKDELISLYRDRSAVAESKIRSLEDELRVATAPSEGGRERLAPVH